MHELEDYLDRAMRAARLAPADERRVRRELREHLTELLESCEQENRTKEEAWAMTEKEFGDPEDLGRRIAGAKGGFLAYLKRKSRKAAIAACLVLAAGFSVNAFAIGVFKIPGASVEPYAMHGSRVAVNRLASAYAAGDLVVFRDGGLYMIAIVKEVLANGGMIVGKNGQPDRTIGKDRIQGRVFLQTR